MVVQKKAYFIKPLYLQCFRVYLPKPLLAASSSACISTINFWTQYLSLLFARQHVKKCRGYLREQDVESDLAMLPDGINGSNSHSVGGADRCVGGGEDQEVAAVHALGFQLNGQQEGR